MQGKIVQINDNSKDGIIITKNKNKYYFKYNDIHTSIDKNELMNLNVVFDIGSLNDTPNDNLVKDLFDFCAVNIVKLN